MLASYMELDYNFLNILILFGALQGFILCGFLYKKRALNKLGVDFFLLFVFSLAFYNLIYALLDMNLFAYHRPLHMFPFPYKWLLGAGLYFYVKNQFSSKDTTVFHKKEWYLLLPALLYFLLRIYWFSIAIEEDSYRITQVVVTSEFFRIHEYFFLVYSICMGIASLLWIRKNSNGSAKKSIRENRKWLLVLSKVFIIVFSVDLLLYTADLMVHNNHETFAFYYPVLIINSVFIYWLGLKGFTKSHLLFRKITSETSISIQKQSGIAVHFEEALHKEIYLDSNISLTSFAAEIGCTTKELSNYINSFHGMNFSEFINLQRVEKVKELLHTAEAKKYTLVTLAEMAGFTSKSTFNAEFKKVTGKTPSAYKKELYQ